MKRSLQNGKRRILTIATFALFIVIAASFGVTFALLANNATTQSQNFTIGSLKIEIREQDGAATTSEKFSYSDTDGLSQDSEVTMNGSISLKDKSVTSFLRIKPIIEYTISEAGLGNDEKTALQTAKTNFETAFLEQIFGNADGSNNKKGVFYKDSANVKEWYAPSTADGYYYYAGEFNNAMKSVINGKIKMPNVDAFQDSTIKLSFKIEAIQSKGLITVSSETWGGYTAQQKVDAIKALTAWGTAFSGT